MNYASSQGQNQKVTDSSHSCFHRWEFFLTAILDREAFTELHLSFRRSMTMMNPMLAASRLQRQDIAAAACS